MESRGEASVGHTRNLLTGVAREEEEEGEGEEGLVKKVVNSWFARTELSEGLDAELRESQGGESAPARELAPPPVSPPPSPPPPPLDPPLTPRPALLSLRHTLSPATLKVISASPSTILNVFQAVRMLLQSLLF